MPGVMSTLAAGAMPSLAVGMRAQDGYAGPGSNIWIPAFAGMTTFRGKDGRSRVRRPLPAGWERR
jgi:hypothetical protein